MDILTKRKRGGQPGNKNAVGNRGPLKDGHFSRWAKEARWARWQSLQAEERRRFEEWSAPIEARCRLQHARIIAELEAERRLRALTEPDLWPPID